MPEVRQPSDSDFTEFDRGIFRLLQRWGLYAPEAIGVLSSQEEKPNVGTDWWLDFAVGDGDYEIVDEGDGSFAVRRKDYSAQPPPPPPVERPPVCLEFKHVPQEYVGFTEAYLYCAICDAKKLNGKWVRN